MALLCATLLLASLATRAPAAPSPLTSVVIDLRDPSFRPPPFTPRLVFPRAGEQSCEMMRKEMLGPLHTPYITDDERHEINQEEEQKLLTTMLAENPELTLWDIFLLRAHKIGQDVKHARDKLDFVSQEALAIFFDTLKWIVLDLFGFFRWMTEIFHEPKKWAHSIKGWFSMFGKGVKALWHMMWHNPPAYTVKMLTGAIALEISDEPDKFLAETALLLGGGFYVIHGFMSGISLIAGTMPPAVKTAMVSSLIFIHALDEPILILTRILDVVSQSVGGVAGGAGHVTYTLIIPDGLEPRDRIPELPTCLLPVASLAYQLTYGDFCTLTGPRAQEIMFGDANPPENMTQAEIVEAQKKFHDFACCYGPLKFTPPGLENETVWQNAPVTMHDCKLLRGTYLLPARGNRSST